MYVLYSGTSCEEFMGGIQNKVSHDVLIDKINNKFHGLLPLGGLVSPSRGFASLVFDQADTKNSQCM